MKSIEDIFAEEKVQEMKLYIQHGKVTTYQHCLNVMNQSERIDSLFNLKCNKENLKIGAFLHDFYLYDWHKKVRN